MTTAYRDAVLADTPQLYYRLGEAVGTTAASSVIDASGNSRSGTPSNVTFGSTGISDDADTAAAFTSVSSSNITTPYNPNGQSAFTLEFWFQATAANCGLFSSNNGGAFVVAFNSSNQLQVMLSTSATSRAGWLFSQSGLTLNQWYHVVYTYDSATTTALLYIDGQQLSSASYPSGGTLSFLSQGNLRLGSATSDFGNYLGGRLDEVAWYNFALTATRVAAHYNAAASNAITRPRMRLPYMYAEQVVKPKPRMRVPYMYAEQVVQPKPRTRVPYMFSEQVLVKKPVPAGYYANILDAATADFETGVGQLQAPPSHWWNSVSQSGTVHNGSGSFSAKVDYTTTGQTDVYVTAGGDVGSGFAFGMVPGYKYTFSCYVYVPGGTDPSIKPYIEFSDTDATGNQVTAGTAPTVTYGQWYRISATRTVRSSATSANIRIYMGQHGSVMNAQASIYLDQLMLDPTTSSALSPWQPGGFQGFLADASGSAARHRGVALASAIAEDASFTAYVNMHSTAARTRGAFGLGSLFSSTATPLNVTGAVARTRGATGNTVVKVSNDNVADAASLVSASTPFDVTSSYTKESFEPYAQYYTGWWKFTASTTGTFTATITAFYYLTANFFSGPASNPTFATLAWVAGDQTSYSVYNGTQIYTVPVTAGTTYYLQLQSYYGYELTGSIAITPPAVVVAAQSTLTRARTTTAVRTSLTARLASFTTARTYGNTLHADAGQTLYGSATLARQRGATATGSGSQRYVDATATLTRQRTVSGHGQTATPPPNDSPMRAVRLVGQSGSSTFTTVASTLDIFDPALPDAVTDAVGSVWFVWVPTVAAQAGFTTSAGTGLDAFATTDDWIAVDSGGSGWFAGAQLKMYRVHIASDMTQVLTWTPPADGPTQTRELDFYLADPGDVTADTFLTGPTVTTWNSYPSGWTAPHVAHPAAFGMYPAGDYYLVSTQWGNNISAGSDIPPDSWDVSTAFGTFTDRNGNSVAAPFTIVDQVVLGFSARPLTTPMGAGDGSVTFTTRAGEAYALRAYALALSNETTGLTLNWATTGLSVNVVMPPSPLTVTPTTATLYIAAEPPGETLTVTLSGDPTVLATTVVASDGTSTLSVPIGTLADGSYNLLVTSDLGGTTTVPFTVAATVVTTTEGSPPPPPAVNPAPVNRWQLQDPATGDTWVFPINPMSAESTMLPRNITAKTTTAIDGQPLLFEGRKRAASWQFKGHVMSLADRATLEAWVAKPNRIYLTDDFGRTFVVKLLQAQMAPERDALHPEHHSYTVVALLYGRAS